MEDIKIRRLGWAGHIIRMGKERIPKKVLKGNVYTIRPVGRPRTRWPDVVQRDALHLLGIRGWRRRVENRNEWRRLMREAKDRKGMWRHIWMDGAGHSCTCPVLCNGIKVLYGTSKDVYGTSRGLF